MTEIESLFSELDTHVAHGEHRHALELIDLLLQQEELNKEEQERVYRVFEDIQKR